MPRATWALHPLKVQHAAGRWLGGRERPRSAMPRRGRALLRGAALWLLCGGLVGCGFLKSLVGANTVDLEGAEVQSMSVDIRRQEKTICPRQSVQMAVFVDAKLDGEDKVAQFETYRGDESHNGKLEFSWFAFHSGQGSFNTEGWFTPSKDLLVTAGHEFEIKSVYRKRPDQFSFDLTYKPDYRCITAGGAQGAAGYAGSSGAVGAAGESGSYSSDGPGARGGDGQNGGNGGPGSNGAPGPEVHAYATLVKTPFYDRLVAVVLEGGASDLLLFHPEATLRLYADGGDAGPGGAGGQGGPGGRGSDGDPSGDGGGGGPGGNGGAGGNGGPGGTLVLHLDPRFPELADRFLISVAGGAAGPGGYAGGGGSAGDAGSPRSTTNPDGTSRPGTKGQSGVRGQDGQAGASGSPGPQGTSRVEREAVDAHFQGLAGLTPL